MKTSDTWNKVCQSKGQCISSTDQTHTQEIKRGGPPQLSPGGERVEDLNGHKPDC